MLCDICMIFMIHLQSAYGAVALISIGLGVHQLSISGGFMYSHVDVAGPKFSSIAFGVTNTAAVACQTRWQVGMCFLPCSYEAS